MANNIKEIRIQETDFTSEEQALIDLLRKEGKFVYHLRNSEDNQEEYLISKFALINRIGFLISDTNLEIYMNEEKFISNKDLQKIENLLISYDNTLKTASRH